jgi:regulatory protein
MEQACGCVFLIPPLWEGEATEHMRRITAIEAQKKNPERVNVYLDDQFSFGLARIVAAWLVVGQSLSEEKIAALQAEDAREAAYQKALRFLSYRPRSVDEVRRNLQKHKVPTDVIGTTLERLQNGGLLGDVQFAQAWVDNRNAFRPRSRRALAAELRRKGLADEVIQSALDGTVDEAALALDAAHKYVRKLDGLEWQEFRKKLGGFLGRRGFSYEVIAPVLRRVWEETRTERTEDIYDEDAT